MLALLVLLASSPATAGTSASLSLQQAVDGALARSPDLEASLLSLDSAALAPERLDAAWAWTAFAEGGVNRDELPRRSPFESETLTTIPLTAGASRLFPTGTFVEVRTDNSWFDSPTPDLFESFAAVNPDAAPITSGWNHGASVLARHPIWGKSQPRLLELQKEQLEADIRAGGARIASGLDQVLADVHRRFWGQALAQEALALAEEGVRAAEEIFELVDRKRRRGFADARDTLRATAATQQAIEQRLGSERALDQARRQLLDRIGEDLAGTRRVEYALDQPVQDEAIASLVARAEAASLTLRSLEAAKRSQRTAVALAEAQQGSSLSAVGRVTEQALFPNGEGFDDDFGFSAFAGLRWETTFGDADARTRARQAAIEMRRLDAETAAAKQRIRLNVSDAVAAIGSARERVANAEKLVETQEKRLREEQESFAIGRAVLRDVIEARQSLTAARFSLAAARVALQMAATDRDLATGALTADWRRRLAERHPIYREISGGTK